MSKFINPWPQYLDENGNPYAGGTVFFGQPNQDPVNNPKAPFSDKSLQVELGASQKLDDKGMFQTAIFLSRAYSVSLFDVDGNFVRTDPEITGGLGIDKDNIVDLRATTDQSDGVSVTVLGHTSAGDGGGGLFRFDVAATDTDDNGVFITPDVGDGRWIRLFDDENNEIDARWYGIAMDGTDETTVYQAIVATAVASQLDYISLPVGTLGLTDALISNNSAGLGIITKGQTPYVNGFVSGNNKTRILFTPSTVKDLFVFDGTGAVTTYGSKAGLIDLSVQGNTTVTGGNSRYCINIDNMAQCEFRNVGIEKFETGIFIKDCMDIDYNGLYIQTCFTAGVEFTVDTGLTTTNTFEGGRIAVCPWAIIIKDGISNKFNNMIIENNKFGILNQYKEAYSTEFNFCHCEDNPTDATATNQAFRIGYDGTTLAADNNQLIINGGHYTGRAAGSVGTWLSCDEVDQVKVVNSQVRGYVQGVETTANTSRGGAIMLINPNFASVTTVEVANTDYDIVGMFPTGQINTSTPKPQLKMPIVRSNFLKVDKALNFTGIPQTLSGTGGGIALETAITHLETTGLAGFSLADATTDGELKYITMTVDGGNAIVTPTSLAGGTTITFSNVGDTAHLVFTNSEWQFFGGSAVIA